MNESLHEELFPEPKSSAGLRLVAGLAALAVAAALLLGYAYLRQRHVESSAAVARSGQTPSPEPRKPPKAMVLVDEALMQGSKTVVGGTVRNISTEQLGQVMVELELKRRQDGGSDRKLIALTPSELEPSQEGRYSLELKAQEYGSVRLIGLRAGPDSSIVVYNSALGQKRPPERLESKTIIVDKPSSKRQEFLNSPENPARVP
jgi:hypothetical protein